MKRIIIAFLFICTCLKSFAQLDAVCKAAQNGDVDAQKYLAEIYLKGKDGVKKNLSESYKWYLAAARQGDAAAQFETALFYYKQKNGNISNTEKSEMMHWLVKSADNGYAPAQYYLGNFAIDSNQYDNAFTCFLESAKRSFPPAYAELADCYYYGYGTSADFSKAAEWYYKAVEEKINISKTLLQLGLCYLNIGNFTKGEQTFEEGVKMGIPLSYVYLAYMYEEGNGVTKNIPKACQLISDGLAKLQHDDDYAKSESGGWVLVMSGSLYLRHGMTQDAINVWNKIKSINSNFASTSDNDFCVSMRNLLNNSVDSNIAETKKISNNTYVVIIGNENYKREVSVPFANNDAKVFKEYCTKTLGVPDKNIKCVIDATYNDIKYCVNWLKDISSVLKGQAKVIFYYAGHGVPDESQKNTYLLPVDGYSTDVSTGYCLADLYKHLDEANAQSAIVLLDACFSGAKRNGGMLATARGVAIKAQPSKPQGNMVVLSAAQGDETAYPYKEQQHGLFTYFLLKKLQETKGDVCLGELSQYIKDQVQQYSIRENGKIQTPTTLMSTDIVSQWKSWTLK